MIATWVACAVPFFLPIASTDALDPIVVDVRPPAEVVPYRLSLIEKFPPLRGFRAPILGNALIKWPLTLPAEADRTMRRAANIVATRLALDGLVATTAQAIHTMGTTAFLELLPEQQVAALRDIGIPVDLLRCFEFAGTNGTETPERVSPTNLARRLLSDEFQTPDAPGPSRIEVRFKFRSTQPAFRVAMESGEHEIGMVRVQLTRGDDWLATGDGGNVDVIRQLVEQIPDADFVATLNREGLPAFLATSASWQLHSSANFTLLCESFSPSQWAQDNGKAGFLVDDENRPARGATLAPRYASRREEGSVFIPGESFAMEGLFAADHAVFQSPLLFQGGNLLAVRDAASDGTILLIGEAEIYRNVALGLTREQALEAFQIEFGVKECRVLPAVSFHIDYDLSVRVVGRQTFAFVCDDDAGARLVLAAGVDALLQHGELDVTAATAALEAISAGSPEGFLKTIGPFLAKRVDSSGHFAESFARVFSTSPTDSHVGNLRLFLVAMDTFVHALARSSNPETQAYLRSFERLAEDQRRLRDILKNWGWDVVPIPSLGDGNRAICPINGIQDRGHYYMPAIGGLYSRVDDAAAERLRSALGPKVEIVRILCGESQRRAGALHCSASVYPRIVEPAR